MALNLEKQLLFYGAYHHDPVNVGIHITCVPMIMFTSLLMASNIPGIPTPVPNLPLDISTVAAVLYCVLYILMEPVAGALVTPLVLGGTAYGHHLISTYGATANLWALGVWTFSWIAQFIGHGKFEGRAPALLDNLVQALFLAPFFVWFHILFFFGYRPELRKRLDQAVEKEISKFMESRKKVQESNGRVNGVKKS